METSTCNMLLRFGSHISLPFPDHVESRDKHTLPFSYRFRVHALAAAVVRRRRRFVRVPGREEKSNTKTLSW